MRAGYSERACEVLRHGTHQRIIQLRPQAWSHTAADETLNWVTQGPQQLSRQGASWGHQLTSMDGVHT
jgi:hypothetical protein